MFLINWICQIIPVPQWLIPPVISLLLSGTIFLLWKRQGVNRAASLIAGLTILFFSLVDWLLLAELPVLNISYGPVVSSWVTFTLLLLVIYLVLTIFLRIMSHKKSNIFERCVHLSLATLWLFNLILITGLVDSMYIEPFNLNINNIRISAPPYIHDRPLRVIQLSDIHVERITKREQQLINIVNDLQADLILLTGDYVNIDYNLDPIAQNETRTVLTQLHAKYGIFAVSGSPMVDPPSALKAVFDETDIHLLNDEIIPIEFEQNTIFLVGISNIERERDRNTLIQLTSQIEPDNFIVLLYHVPDPEMVDTALASGVDLFLAGHTHGGQIRLPVIGSPIRFFGGWLGKYEIGEYDLGSTILYVNSGVGMEGLSMPRMRFLVPPEIALFELGSQEDP
jgi:predicted MPP superfamily phosphohydrolase